jgi:hypothetical protein
MARSRFEQQLKDAQKANELIARSNEVMSRSNEQLNIVMLSLSLQSSETVSLHFRDYNVEKFSYAFGCVWLRLRMFGLMLYGFKVKGLLKGFEIDCCSIRLEFNCYG